MKQKQICLALVLMILIGLAACSGTEAKSILTPDSASSSTPIRESSSTATEKPTDMPVPTATPKPTEMPPTETPLPPSEVPVSPTPVPPTATPTEEPTAVLEEVLAEQSQDIIGTWESPLGHQMEISESGDVRIRNEDGTKGAGSHRFEDGQLQLVFDKDTCLKLESGFGVAFDCVGMYSIYLVTDGDTIVAVRFEAIEDPYRDRREVIQDTWQRVEG